MRSLSSGILLREGLSRCGHGQGLHQTLRSSTIQLKGGYQTLVTKALLHKENLSVLLGLPPKFSIDKLTWLSPVSFCTCKNALDSHANHSDSFAWVVQLSFVTCECQQCLRGRASSWLQNRFYLDTGQIIKNDGR